MSYRSENSSRNASVFGQDYAISYDLLYQDKDYERECDFIEKITRKYSPNAKTILDLGCGTGGHALIIAKRGYHVLGVDHSKNMLDIAKRKANEANLSVEFIEDDITNLELQKKFDAVISMFAVMSYQIENNDLALACRTAKRHLKPGGIFTFDAWNGLAVMTDLPAPRVKEINKENESIIRIAKPELDPLSHTVNIYLKIITLRGKQLISEIEEIHKMRFFFPQEIKYFLEVAGFSYIKFCPFLKPGKRLSSHDWSMTVIAQ